MVYVGPRFGMSSILKTSLPKLKICPKPAQTDMGIPVSEWGPRFECRSNLGTQPQCPKLE